uniref:Serpentine receptor class gamma n=1 Tax=Rhabditophanes sp. KR3021 TaxID=114890 RepID=A0AC35TTD1_9BILA
MLVETIFCFAIEINPLFIGAQYTISQTDGQLFSDYLSYDYLLFLYAKEFATYTFLTILNIVLTTMNYLKIKNKDWSADAKGKLEKTLLYYSFVVFLAFLLLETYFIFRLIAKITESQALTVFALDYFTFAVDFATLVDVPVMLAVNRNMRSHLLAYFRMGQTDIIHVKSNVRTGTIQNKSIVNCKVWFIYNPEIIKSLYSCDALSDEDWRKFERSDMAMGVLCIIMGVIYELMYIPVLLVIRQEEFQKNSA